MPEPFYVASWSAYARPPNAEWHRYGEVKGEDLGRTTDAAMSLAVGAVQAYKGPLPAETELFFQLTVSVQRWPNYASYSNYKARCASDRTVQLDQEEGGQT